MKLWRFYTFLKTNLQSTIYAININNLYHSFEPAETPFRGGTKHALAKQDSEIFGIAKILVRQNWDEKMLLISNYTIHRDPLNELMDHSSA